MFGVCVYVSYKRVLLVAVQRLKLFVLALYIILHSKPRSKISVHKQAQ